MKRAAEPSIRWRIYAGLIGYAAVFVVILWLGLSLALNLIYKIITVERTKSSAESIATAYQSEPDDKSLDEISRESGLCVVITDLSGNSLYSYSSRINCVLHSYNTSRLTSAARLTLINGGRYIVYYENEAGKPIDKDDQLTDGPQSSPNTQKGRGPLWDNTAPISRLHATSVVYSIASKSSAGDDVIVFVSTVIVPVFQTVSTLNILLVLLSIVMAGVALIVALLITRTVSVPIERLNQSAKKLAAGDYKAHFDEKGYREISELAATLNYTSSELAKVESLRRELIANVSHDLKTPLTLISGYAEMMRDIPGEDNAENIQVIIDETHRLSTLVADMLDISKMQAETQELKPEKIRLGSVIESALGSYAKLIQGAGCKVVFERKGDGIVLADEHKLVQVLYNLINNGINYCGADKLIIVREELRGDIIRVSVIDHGSGISQEMLPYIWDRYYKDSSSHIRPIAGTGLGLSIVKEILTRHGADYGVETKLGEGSEFWFELKLWDQGF